jgi:hypothetical protein
MLCPAIFTDSVCNRHSCALPNILSSFNYALPLSTTFIHFQPFSPPKFSPSVSFPPSSFNCALSLSTTFNNHYHFPTTSTFQATSSHFQVFPKVPSESVSIFKSVSTLFHQGTFHCSSFQSLSRHFQVTTFHLQFSTFHFPGQFKSLSTIFQSTFRVSFNF